MCPSSSRSSATRRPGRRSGSRDVLSALARSGRAPRDDPRRFWHLARTLAVTDFKLRFFGSVLGYLWQLFRPLLLVGVLLLVFTEFVHLAKDVNHYDVC